MLQLFWCTYTPCWCLYTAVQVPAAVQLVATVQRVVAVCTPPAAAYAFAGVHTPGRPSVPVHLLVQMRLLLERQLVQEVKPAARALSLYGCCCEASGCGCRCSCFSRPPVAVAASSAVYSQHIQQQLLVRGLEQAASAVRLRRMLPRENRAGSTVFGGSAVTASLLLWLLHVVQRHLLVCCCAQDHRHARLLRINLCCTRCSCC